MWKSEFISECSPVSFSTYTFGVSHWIWRPHWMAEQGFIEPPWPSYLSPQSWDYRHMLLHSAFAMGIGNWTQILMLPWQALSWAVSPVQPWDSDKTFFHCVHKLMVCRELESIVLFNGFSCVDTAWFTVSEVLSAASYLLTINTSLLSSYSFCLPAYGSSF